MIPSAARVVVVGSGIAGASIAYHLAQLGCGDVVVLDSGPLVGGTTSHAPGLVGQLRSSVSLTRMLMYSVSLYRTLQIDSTPGFHEVGSLRLAASPERMEELQRQVGFARGVGLDAYLLSTDEALKLFPYMNPDGVHGALYLPSDGSATAPVLARAMIKAAQAGGISFFPHTRIENIVVRGGKVHAVATSAGTIETETVVAAAGIWSPLIGRMAGVSLPLTPMQHQYAATGPVPELRSGPTLPNLRDPDRLVYVRQRSDTLVLGGYERDPRTFDVHAISPTQNPTVLPFDAEHFASLQRSLEERVPLLRAHPLQEGVNGLESFTPDGEFLLGPVAEVRGFWAACGFCAHGVSGAGGVGKVMAEWIVQGEPELDLWHMDVRRVGGYASSGSYISGRATEVYRTYYDILYPGYERSAARGLRTSPMYEQLRALGAVFGEKAGWERPNWFEPNAALAAGELPPQGWAGRHWSPAIAGEHRATRERVALFDQTSFSKLEVQGRGALAALQRLTANQMDKPVGSITYTQMLNERGGIECDLTVTRLGDEHFRLVTGTAFGTHDLHWIRRNLPLDGSVQARDVTSQYCCIGLFGPRARDVLQEITGHDVSNEAFPYLTAGAITIGAIPVLALRVTYVGELGWEIYAPTEYGRALWTVLWEAGQRHGMVAAGYRAIESLRLEKGYRYWSTDIHSEHTPYEAGLGFAVRLRKGDFTGRDALLAARERGLQRTLCCLTLDDPGTVVSGNEPLLDGDRVIGRVTSGGYGYTVRQSIAYAYLPVAYAEPGTTVDLLWFGRHIAATVQREPLYDPGNSKIKEVSTGAAS